MGKARGQPSNRRPEAATGLACPALAWAADRVRRRIDATASIHHRADWRQAFDLLAGLVRLHPECTGGTPAATYLWLTRPRDRDGLVVRDRKIRGAVRLLWRGEWARCEDVADEVIGMIPSLTADRVEKMYGEALDCGHDRPT